LLCAPAFAGCGREAVASDVVGRWMAEPQSAQLLKGRLSATTYALTLKPDGSALFENVPQNLYGNPPGPLLNGAGSWRLKRSSGRTVLEGMLPPSRSFEIEVQTGRDPTVLYIDLTDPDQMERFTYLRSSP
jgi:hypothetical protein